MAEAKDRASTAMVAGGGAALGVALALLLSGKARAAAPSDEAVLALLQSIAQSGVGIDTDTDDILAILNAIAAKMGAAALENPPNITAFRVLPVAMNVPVQLPYRVIPYDKELVIKGWWTNLGTVLVAPNRADAMNINSSYPLIANEAIEYKVRNADHIWVSIPIAFGNLGDSVVCTVEQEATQ